MAQVYIAQGDYGRAITTLLSLPKADQSTPVPHFQLGLAYAGRGDKDKALVELQKAIDLGDEDPAVRFELAAVLRTLGENQEAENQLKIYKQEAQEKSDLTQACRWVQGAGYQIASNLIPSTSPVQAQYSSLLPPLQA